MDEDTRQRASTLLPLIERGHEPVVIHMRLDLAQSLQAQLKVVSAGIKAAGHEALAAELDRIIGEFMVLPS